MWRKAKITLKIYKCMFALPSFNVFNAISLRAGWLLPLVLRGWGKGADETLHTL